MLYLFLILFCLIFSLLRFMTFSSLIPIYNFFLLNSILWPFSSYFCSVTYFFIQFSNSISFFLFILLYAFILRSLRYFLSFFLKQYLFSMQRWSKRDTQLAIKTQNAKENRIFHHFWISKFRGICMKQSYRYQIFLILEHLNNSPISTLVLSRSGRKSFLSFRGNCF